MAVNRNALVPVLLTIAWLCLLTSCGGTATEAKAIQDPPAGHEVGIIRAHRMTLQRDLSVSSELVPFQQIEVYAKESGFVRQLNVDYGTRVKAGQTMAVLEIPELRMQLEEDDAEIKDAADQIQRLKNEMDRVQAQHRVTSLEFTRLNGVAKSQPGLVAQQEVDDAQGRDLATEAQVEAAQASIESSESLLARAQARKRHDQALYDYSDIVAPFDGVVTQRYANLGTLMQSGISSSTNVLPLVQLSQDNLFRLVIPVAESFVPYIRVGQPVEVRVPSLNRTFSGKVARFSVDVNENTRTMHTEVDVANPDRVLVPGLYAVATFTLDLRKDALSVPEEAINIEGDQRSVWLVDSSNHIRQRRITIGVETANDAEVVSGLREGDAVVVGDRSSLTAGEAVQPRPVQLAQSSGQED